MRKKTRPPEQAGRIECSGERAGHGGKGPYRAVCSIMTVFSPSKVQVGVKVT